MIGFKIKMTKREKWFVSRIGKKVYRNNTYCCEHCLKIFKNGLIIKDRQHASYLRDTESEFTISGNPVKYFDTKKEALAFDKKVKDKWLEAFRQSCNKFMDENIKLHDEVYELKKTITKLNMKIH